MLARRRLLAPVLALSLAFGGISLAATPAAACLAVAVDAVSPAVHQSAARLLFVEGQGSMTAHVQIRYYGQADKFSWIVPVEAPPNLSVGSEAIFEALEAATTHRFTLTHRTEGECKETERSTGSPASARAPIAAPAAEADAGAGVEVISREAVGPYDAAVLTAEDPEALKKWLTANGYVVPERLDPMLDPYVEKGFAFVALKLQQDKTAGDLQPIVLEYAASKVSLPIRLASLSATPDMDVKLWVLGKARAVPENYLLTEINQARVDWLGGGGNYRQVVTEAMNEAGGKAFVTDYAGDSRVVDLQAMPMIGAPMMDLPASGVIEARPEGREELQALIAENPYLTALYTTMSPDEMVEDAAFVFNPDMEKVAREHRAEAIRECSPMVFAHEAPMKIRLDGGITYYLTEEAAPAGERPTEGKPVTIPAAGRVMRCGTVGAPKVQTNNLDGIIRTLANLARQGIAIRVNTTAGAT
ncbi:MAG: DUF2330 domain-containing protein, partial [Candidatus Sericytochromatia bacterium]